MAIVLDEPLAGTCMAVLDTDDVVLISAGTLAEALVVSAMRHVHPEMTTLLASFGFRVVPVSETAAREVGLAYQRWGKGVNPAALNFGDCFAYQVAMENACPLLFIGRDFAQTDVLPAVAPGS
jgi:ribonuclease VapC